MDLLDCHGVVQLDLRAAHASKGVDDARTTNKAESEQDQSPRRATKETEWWNPGSSRCVSDDYIILHLQFNFRKISWLSDCADWRCRYPTGVVFLFFFLFFLFPKRYRRIHRKSELRDREAEKRHDAFFLRRWKRVFFFFCQPWKPWCLGKLRPVQWISCCKASRSCWNDWNWKILSWPSSWNRTVEVIFGIHKSDKHAGCFILDRTISDFQVQPQLGLDFVRPPVLSGLTVQVSTADTLVDQAQETNTKKTDPWCTTSTQHHPTISLTQKSMD